MRDVDVIGAAMIPMGKHRSSSYPGLAAPTVLDALRSANVAAESVDAVYCGSSFGGMLTGQRIAKTVGLGGIPVVNVENACSGGATAMYEAHWAVAEGRADIAVVIGVDQLTQFGGGTIPLVEMDWEVQLGMVMPALYAMRARRYIHEREASLEDLANVSVKARRHGTANPYAQLRGEVTVDEVLASRMIADPLTLMQCCPTGDGAATVVIAAADVARQTDIPRVRVRSSVLHSGTVTGGFREMLRPQITYDSAREAYEQAAITPSDLDVVELHDAFTIAELVYYEALGLCAPGESVKLLRSGETTYGGRTVVNPSGGLLSKGHPVGASGVAQVVEMYWQLTDQAGGRQVPDARVGLTHVTGGGISGLDHGACTVHIFEGPQ